MIAASILSKDVPLLEATKQDRYLVFIFDDYRKCKELEELWWQGTLSVEAPKYAASIKRLKSLVYSKLEN
jgi:hypothetical protein